MREDFKITKPKKEILKKALGGYNDCGHNLLNYRLGYIGHHTEMEKRHKKGRKQFRCKKCGLYLYKDEQPTSITKPMSNEWISAKKKQPVKKGFYSIKGLNNQGLPVRNDDIWFTGKFWMVREGCIVTHWRHINK